MGQDNFIYKSSEPMDVNGKILWLGKEYVVEINDLLDSLVFTGVSPSQLGEYAHFKSMEFGYSTNSWVKNIYYEDDVVKGSFSIVECSLPNALRLDGTVGWKL